MTDPRVKRLNGMQEVSSVRARLIRKWQYLLLMNDPSFCRSAEEVADSDPAKSIKFSLEVLAAPPVDMSILSIVYIGVEEMLLVS